MDFDKILFMHWFSRTFQQAYDPWLILELCLFQDVDK